MGLKVNSYASFNGYWGTFPLIIRIHHAFCPTPDWQIRIHHDDSIFTCPYTPVLNELQALGLIKLIHVTEKVLKTRAMLWRVMPVFDKEVDYCFCKDLDSLITTRERKVMEHFCHSGHSMMGINDNPSHSLELMGGMCGFNSKKFISNSGIHDFGQFMSSMHFSEDQWKNHGTDQILLNNAILPRIRNSLILYRVFTGASHLGKSTNHNSVPNIAIPGISRELEEKGDTITGYIGACGTAVSPHYPYEVMEQFGNTEVNKIIRSIEEKHNIFTPKVR